MNKKQSFEMYNELSVLLGKYDVSPNSIEEHDKIVKELYIKIKADKKALSEDFKEWISKERNN